MKTVLSLCAYAEGFCKFDQKCVVFVVEPYMYVTVMSLRVLYIYRDVLTVSLLH